MELKNIKAILIDIDGVLTDGGIYYDNFGNEFKKFNVKDGQIIPHLRKNSIYIGVITGRDSRTVDKRMEELKIDFYRKGVIDKLKVLEQFLNIFSLSKDEVAFMGDDIIDIPVLKAVGYSGTPADARKYIKEIVDFVAPNKGGDGAFRDFADHILEAKGLLQKIIEQPV